MSTSPAFFLETDRLADRPSEDFTLPSQNEGRSHIGMTGKRNLRLRCIDTHLGRMGGVFWRQHEGRFRQIEFVRDLLHLAVA